MKASITILLLVRRGIASAMMGALVVSLIGCVASPPAHGLPQATEVQGSPITATALVMAGLRAEEAGDGSLAEARYRQAVTAAQRLYGDMHPNTAFAQAGLGLSLVRTGVVREGSRYLRESRQIETRHGEVFVNIAESRLPRTAAIRSREALGSLRR